MIKTIQKLALIIIVFFSTQTITMYRTLQLQSPRKNVSHEIKQQIGQIMRFALTGSEKQCNDLIIIFDPREEEDVTGRHEAMMYTLLCALHEKCAPIIATPNLIKNFCSWKINRKLIVKPGNSWSLVLLDTIHLTNNDWHCFFHQEGDLVLLIPKNYIATHSSEKTIINQMLQCGFSMDNLIAVDDMSSTNILDYIENHTPQNADLIAHFKSMFVSKNTAHRFLHNPSWNIYLTGHGLTPTTKLGLPYYIIDKKPSVQNVYKRKLFAENSSLLNISTEFPDYEIISETAQISGITYNDFIDLISFFNTDIKTSFLYYSTCYGGGFNQNSINKILSHLNVDFITCAAGINENPTTVWEAAEKSKAERGQLRFTPFFAHLSYIFCNQNVAQNITHISLKDPIAAAVSSIAGKHVINQPFIRIPKIGTFKALSSGKTVKILTTSLVRAYEFENKSFTYNDSDMDAIIVYPSYVRVPMIINKKYVAFVSPSIPNSIQEDESIHIFEKIIYEEKLSSIITNFISFNSSYTPIIFVIKNLECLNYRNSGLAVGDHEPITIENMIIKIQGYKRYHPESSNKLDADVDIIFSCNNQNYSLSKTIPGIADNYDDWKRNSTDAFYQFDRAPATLITPEILQDLALKILGTQNTQELKDQTLTLPDIVKQIEKRIDTTTIVQEPGGLKDILLKR